MLHHHIYLVVMSFQLMANADFRLGYRGPRPGPLCQGDERRGSILHQQSSQGSVLVIFCWILDLATFNLFKFIMVESMLF